MCHKPKANLDDELDRIHLSDQNESTSSAKEIDAGLDHRLKCLYCLACGNELVPDINQLNKVSKGTFLTSKQV